MRLVPLESRHREALATSPAFLDLPPAALAAIWERLEQRVYEAGEHLIRQGDVGDSLMLVVGGAATGWLHRDGERRRIAGFRPGDVVGEMAVLTREKRTADIVADEGTTVLALGVEDFEDVAGRYPDVGVVLTRLIADRLGQSAFDVLGGKVVDRYRILRPVGRGAMAVVYEVHELGTEERLALKMMSHRLLYDPGAMDRFRTEADLLLGLSHVNVARVYRRFSAFGTSFIAMEFCEGQELAACIGRGERLPEDRARRLIGQLAAGVAYLHRSDVVHRDIKPSNVMVTVEDVVKLTDFGLAKTGRSERSEARTLVGTPLYMAPEQIKGHEGDVKTDEYAFGCLAYEILTGRRIFSSTDLFDLLEEKKAFVVPPAGELGVREDVREMLAGSLQPRRSRRRLDLDRVAAWAG